MRGKIGSGIIGFMAALAVYLITLMGQVTHAILYVRLAIVFILGITVGLSLLLNDKKSRNLEGENGSHATDKNTN